MKNFINLVHKFRYLLLLCISIVIIIMFIVCINIYINSHNEYIKLSSAQEYKTELLKSIKIEDLELMSDLIYSISNSKYKDELITEVEEYNYYYEDQNNLKTNTVFYNGLIMLIKENDINSESAIKIKSYDKGELKRHRIVYVDYELNKVPTYMVDTHLKTRDSLDVAKYLTSYKNVEECNLGEYTYEQYCENKLYLEMNKDMYFNEIDESELFGYVHYNLVTSNYNTEESSYKVRYDADSKVYETYSMVIAVDYEVNNATPGTDSIQIYGDMSKLEVENLIINKATEANSILIYGDSNDDGVVNEKDRNNGVNIDISQTADEGGGYLAYNDYANRDYLDEEEILDIERMIDNLPEDSNVYNATDGNITKNAYK